MSAGSQVLVLVPVLRRPERAAPVVASLRETAPDARLLFLCSPGDDAEIAACRATGAEVEVCPFEQAAGDYARKINHGFGLSDEPWIFQGADDILFHQGWLEAALEFDREDIGVIGTNDLSNPQVFRKQAFATHSLIRRSYVDEQGASTEGPGSVLSEMYEHNFVDRELIDIARQREAFAFALGSKVEHLHPHWRKGLNDEVYAIGADGFFRDQTLYWQRCRGWGAALSPSEQRALRQRERNLRYNPA